MSAMLSIMFAAAALLCAGTLVHAWHASRHRYGELAAQLRKVERGIPVQFVRREVVVAAATVRRLHFKPSAEARPGHPEHELRAAA